MTNLNRRTIILASTSPYRKQLLAQLHVPFETVDPNIDESPAKALSTNPAELTQNLAEAKAKAVAALRPHDIIIGSDQCISIDGKLLSKPKTTEAAIQQLTTLSGRTHKLVTAVCVLDAASELLDTTIVTHELTMRSLSEEQIQRYIHVDQPLDCAGSYKLESLGVALFEGVSGPDPTSIVGLPLMSLVSMLARLGYDVFASARRV